MNYGKQISKENGDNNRFYRWPAEVALKSQQKWHWRNIFGDMYKLPAKVSVYQELGLHKLSRLTAGKEQFPGELFLACCTRRLAKP